MMAHSIPCPHCRRLLDLPENYHGGEVRCPECQQVFVGATGTDITAQPPMPLGGASTPEVQPGLPPVRPSSPRRRKRLGESTADEDDGLLIPLAFLRDFKDGGSLAFAVKALFTLSILLCVAMLGSNYLQHDLATRAIAHREFPNAEIQDAPAPDLLGELQHNEARQTALGFSYLGLNVVLMIVFLFWFHRVYANLEPLGARHLIYPGWAVGCWIVPFLNLVRPLQIAQEIWRKSDPECVGRDSHAEAPTNSALLGWWWALWLIENVVSNVATRMTLAAKTSENLQSASAAQMFADFTTGLAAALALAVVSDIDARQTARAKTLRATAELPSEDDS